MIINSIKYTYHRFITDKNRDLLRWTLLIGITVYLTVTATPPEAVIERSIIWNVLFWSFNGLLLLFMSVIMVVSIYEAFRNANRKSIGNALCSIAIVALCILFVTDIYNHTVFYNIKQYIISLFC